MSLRKVDYKGEAPGTNIGGTLSASSRHQASSVCQCLTVFNINFHSNRHQIKILLTKEEDKNTMKVARNDVALMIELWLAFQDEVLGEQIAEVKKIFPNKAWPQCSDDCEPKDEVFPLPSIYPPAIQAHILFETTVSAKHEIQCVQANNALCVVEYKLSLKSFLWKNMLALMVNSRRLATRHSCQN